VSEVVVDARPETGSDKGSETVTEAVIVRLGAGRFAVDLAGVAEVGKVPPTTRLPGAPTWLAGVANWRGRLLPVLDVRRLLGADAAPPASTARLLVLTADGITAGVIVDAVDGTGPVGVIEDLPVALHDASNNLLCGQVPRDDGPIAMLDAQAVLRLRDQIPRSRRPA
jgi:purine-binding chemotaxis protein CheW